MIPLRVDQNAGRWIGEHGLADIPNRANVIPDVSLLEILSSANSLDGFAMVHQPKDSHVRSGWQVRLDDINSIINLYMIWRNSHTGRDVSGTLHVGPDGEGGSLEVPDTTQIIYRTALQNLSHNTWPSVARFQYPYHGLCRYLIGTSQWIWRWGWD